jgi:hypothetical protein
MRRPWIKVETATPDKPEICAIATTLRMDADAVLGKLVRLWSWVEVNRVKPNDLGVTKEFLDKLVGRKGFSTALVACGWLTEGDGKLGLKNLDRHNGGLAKVRALTALRVAMHRKRKLTNVPSSVATALHISVLSEVPDSVGELVSDADKNIKIESEQQSDSIDDELEEVPPTDVTEPDSFGESIAPLPSDAPLPSLLADRPELIESEGLTQESSTRKRRSKTDGDSPNQPLLF